ncbi:MAG TPA: type 3 dihydrofolate reductase [Mariprofundaceae bacterium]|nr:type 3 dihydrofolate reductase [Mariprofundaceae bacterium]
MSQAAMLSLIWAMDDNRLIGRENRLPWHLPADLQWFKRNTLGKPILMGRKTFESIGRPLPGRANIVLSRQQGLAIDGCTVVTSLDEAKQMVPGAEEIMVIGGAEIYAALLPRADRLYVTEIHAAFEGDAWFPAFERSSWRETFREAHAADEKNPYAYDFVILERA